MQLVAPFAPHIAEELWETLRAHGRACSMSRLAGVRRRRSRRWTTIELAVQVNGKTRGTIHAARDIDAGRGVALAMADAGDRASS